MRSWAIGGVAGVTAIVFGVLLVVVLTSSNDQCGMGSSAIQPSASASAERSIPANYLKLYEAAGQQYGLEWNILAGIGYRESTHGLNPGVSSAGARGPMQFMTATWAHYAVDGDGDGIRDIMDPADAIPTAARYLKASGAPGDWEKALWHYNQSHQYFLDVMSTARLYATGHFTEGRNNTNATACSPGGAGATMGDINGTVPQRIIAYASKWIGTPYLWGGGDDHGPTKGCGHGFCGTGFDCSGLTKYAVYQATNGRIDLPHYVPDQFGGPVTKVPYAQLQPGDLVAFNGFDHEGIYIGGGKMINAPHTGAQVRVDDIAHGYYRSVFVTGGRVTPSAGGPT